MSTDKYTIVVDGEDVEIDRDSILGKCKEFVDHYESELIKLFNEAVEEFNGK